MIVLLQTNYLNLCLSHVDLNNMLNFFNNMEQPDAILVLAVFYQNLPVSAKLVQILVNTSITVSSRIFQYLQYQKILVIAKICVLQIPQDSGKYWLYQYCRYWKILENTGYTSIADTGRFWKILVIPVLQILEDQLRSCGMYLYIVCASVMCVLQ